MAAGYVQVPADSVGKKVDTFIMADGDHRQVAIIGDSTTDGNYAPVDGTKGLAVDLTATGSNTNAIKVDGSAVTQPISGTVTANAGTGNFTVVQATGTSLHAVLDTTSTTAVTQATAANLNATVVGTGTFATQATLQTQTDTVMIGGVNIKEINAVVPLMGAGNTGTGSLRVTIATDQAQLTNKLLVTPDANSAVNVAQMNGATVTMGNGIAGTGVQRVAIASDNTAFSVNAIESGTWTVQPGNTPNSTPWLTTQTPATSGGLSFTDGTMGATKTQIKGSAGQLFGWYIYNPNSSVSYVQIYNLASASVTVGTTVPDLCLGVPATSAANLELVNGLAMGTGITFAITTTRGGNTTPSSTVDYNFWYK